MNPEEWERIQDLLLKALELETGERERFVDEATQDDPKLRHELTSLLGGAAMEGILDGAAESPRDARKRIERVSRALASRYTVEAEVGRGGMATVYRARDIKHGRTVAIKVLHPSLTNSLGAERFLAEIRTTAGLQHPHILPLFDSGQADGLLYYVMPFVEGETLRTRLGRERQLDVDEAVRITREVADALQAAHEQGVIHRDIKPGNILLSRGRPLVADFGIALAVSAAGVERMTETGLALGTPHYMSPEQATGDRVPDARSDVFSLGCVLYEMLTGEPPHTGATAQSAINRLLAEDPTNPTVLRSSIPRPIAAAVLKALAKVPADRFQTVAEFSEALLRERAPATPRRAVVSVGVAALLSAAALVALGTVWQLGRGEGRAARPVVTASHEQITADPGVEWFPSLSPDGEWVVYAAQTSGVWDIYLKSVGGENPINLTDSPTDDDQPAFSPDGRSIAFRSDRDGGGIFVMGRTGESVRRVTRRGYKPTWSPDGTRLAYATENVEMNPQNAYGPSELWVVDVESGAERRIDAVDAAMPSWSPNGHRIAYTRRLDYQDRGVWTVAAEGGVEVPVTQHLATDWNPVWSPDGGYLYFVSDRSGSMNLWRIAIDERTGAPLGEPEPITTPAVSLGHPSLSADGRTLVYGSAFVSSNIRRQGFDPERAEVVDDGSWLTTGTRRWSSPDPSPDGEWVAFYSLVVPEGDVYVARVDGTSMRRITGDSAIDRVPRWSPDGSWLAFFSDRAGPAATWKVRVDGSRLTQLTDGLGGVPVWSPDGALMAVSPAFGETQTSLVMDPTSSIPVDSFDALPDPDSAIAPFVANSWSPGGEYLAGDIGFTDTGIVVYSFRTRSYERLTDFGQWPVWLPDGRRLLFVSEGTKFFVVDRASKAVKQVYATTSDILGPPRLSPDGRTIYYSRRSSEADLWLVSFQ